VNVNDLIQAVASDLIGPNGSLVAFRAELILCGTILMILAAKIALPRWQSGAWLLTLAGLFAALGTSFPWTWLSQPTPQARAIFTGVLLADSFTAILRVLLLGFAVLFTAFVQLSSGARGVGDRWDERPDELEPPKKNASFSAPDAFFILMLGALLGMCLMISAHHVLIVLLGVEMASVPCYVLAGMQKERSKSSEAALKYAVFGAGAAGVMLYGLSLLTGVLGTAHLPAMGARLAHLLGGGLSTGQATALVLGGLMLMAGVAFKLSAVPFHFWAPDVFEGATAEVAAFLSIASKAAALGLLVRLVAAFSFSPTADPAALEAARHFIGFLLSVMAAVTCTFGNLAAYGQTNMKRLLAYSTIAHAGYMMMPVAAAAALAGGDGDLARSAVAATVVYIAVYLFMNLAAFAFVAFIRNAVGSEEIADYAGLVRRSPGLTVCMAIVLFSLVGLPPLAGFSAKLTILYALVEANLWPLLMIGVLNTVLSLFYYLRVVIVMIYSPEPLYREAPTIPLLSIAGSYCALLTAPLIALFFLLDRLLLWAGAAASSLFR